MGLENTPEHTFYTHVPFLVLSPARKMDTSITANDCALEKSGPHPSLYC